MGYFLNWKRTRRNLFGFEACEAEHPDLVDDMLPVVGGTFIFQASHQLFPHLNDAVGHAVHLLQPLIKHNRFDNTMQAND